MGDPSALLDLPLEIHLAICKNLSLHALRPFTSLQPWGVVTTFDTCAPESFILKSLSQSCRHFRRITFPLRYQRLWLSMDRLDAFIGIIKHFTLYPERGEFVQHLMIDSPPFVSTSPNRPEDETIKLQQEARRLGLQFVRDDANKNLEAFLIDMVLCQLQEVKTLDLEQWPGMQDQVMDATRRQITYGTHLPDSLMFHSLRHLTTVHPGPVGHPVQSYKHAVESLVRRAPSLTSLNVTGLVQESFGLIQINLPELRNLHLQTAVSDDINAIVQHCPRVSSLQLGAMNAPFGVTVPSNGAGDGEALNATLNNIEEPNAHTVPRFLDILLPLASTLRRVTIVTFPTFQTDIGELASAISQFDALTYLFLAIGTWEPESQMALIDSLPHTLEYLCLGRNTGSAHDLAVAVRGQVDYGAMPNLKEFQCLLAYHPSTTVGESDEIKDMIADVFEGTGITSIVDRDPFPT